MNASALAKAISTTPEADVPAVGYYLQLGQANGDATLIEQHEVIAKAVADLERHLQWMERLPQHLMAVRPLPSASPPAGL